MGDAQRIIYIHVPVARLSLLGLLLMAGGGGMYLLRRNLAWDQWSQAAPELGWLCCGLTLLTGSLWAHEAWGTWWTWDPRLSSAFILWMIYSAYLILPAANWTTLIAALAERGSGRRRGVGWPPGDRGGTLVPRHPSCPRGHGAGDAGSAHWRAPPDSPPCSSCCWRAAAGNCSSKHYWSSANNSSPHLSRWKTDTTLRDAQGASDDGVRRGIRDHVARHNRLYLAAGSKATTRVARPRHVETTSRSVMALTLLLLTVSMLAANPPVGDGVIEGTVVRAIDQAPFPAPRWCCGRRSAANCWRWPRPRPTPRENSALSIFPLMAIASTLPGANRDGIHYPGPSVRLSSLLHRAQLRLAVHDAVTFPNPLVVRRHEIILALRRMPFKSRSGCWSTTPARHVTWANPLVKTPSR